MGHTGVSRPLANPDKQVEVTADRCPDCGNKLEDPIIEIDSRCFLKSAYLAHYSLYSQI